MQTNNKHDEFSAATDVEAVKRALENIGDSSKKPILKSASKDTIQRRRFTHDHNVIVEKQSLGDLPRKSYFHNFTDKEKLHKPARKSYVYSDQQGDELKKITHQLELLTEQNQRIEQSLLTLQKHIDRLEKLNNHLSEKINVMSMNSQQLVEKVVNNEGDHEKENVVNELGQAPVKWWIKK